MLAEKDPTINQDLADSLKNLGRDFRSMGRHEDAACADEEAVMLYRTLATKDLTINQDLADSLDNLGTDLGNMGRHEDAIRNVQEAVRLRRTLTETDPTDDEDLVCSRGIEPPHIGRHEDAPSAD